MLFYASFNMRKITFILVYKALVLTSNNHTHTDTHRDGQTDRHAHHNTPLPYGGGGCSNNHT